MALGRTAWRGMRGVVIIDAGVNGIDSQARCCCSAAGVEGWASIDRRKTGFGSSCADLCACRSQSPAATGPRLKYLITVVALGGKSRWVERAIAPPPLSSRDHRAHGRTARQPSPALHSCSLDRALRVDPFCAPATAQTRGVTKSTRANFLGPSELQRRVTAASMGSGRLLQSS